MKHAVKAGVKNVLGTAGRVLENIPARARIFAAPDRQVFFGYYDVTPFSGDDRLLLATQAPEGNVSPHETHSELKLGFYDLTQEQPQFQKFGATKTWNWQQGCRLQWLGEGRVIYNTLVDGGYGSVVQDVKSGEILKSFSRPVYSVSGKGAISLDFGRLHQYRRGYGYSNVAAAGSEDIILMDLEGGAEKTVLSMAQAREFQPHEDMVGAAHYFNHLAFSPGGARFMVTHLWVTAQGKRRTRILIVDMADGAVTCPDNSGRTSHYCWLDDDRAVIFHVIRNLSGQYILYDLKTGGQDILFGNILGQDGHPTITGDLFITDTYPDLTGLQHLYMCDRRRQECRRIARLHAPAGFIGEMRCDLHPRLNHAGDAVCVDAIRDGRRAMILLELPDYKD